jgi:hypothetical protein
VITTTHLVQRVSGDTRGGGGGTRQREEPRKTLGVLPYLSGSMHYSLKFLLGLHSPGVNPNA